MVIILVNVLFNDHVFQRWDMIHHLSKASVAELAPTTTTSSQDVPIKGG